MPRVRNQFRIIGGRYRGRKLRFPDLPGLRPTPDRVRETLFNWLMPVLPGARCLDLFAGSGALGFEALSRGAAAVTFVEREPQAVKMLRDNLALLQVDGGEVVQADALAFLAGPARPHDIVFLDPPYQSDLLPPCLERLAAGDWLAPGARLYVETPARTDLPPLPAGWSVHRSKRAGGVGYHLIRTAGG
jgi:16S rRNA (guanine966-N2)-methyltransferase